MIPSLVYLIKPLLQQEFADERMDDFDGFVRVEVGLRLLEVLDLTDQTPLTIWALLQGHDLPAQKALHLDQRQRRWLANFRALVHQSSASDWQNDIELYADLPEDLRMYQIIFADNPGDIRFCRTGRQEFRAARYDDTMEKILAHRTTKKNAVKANVEYIYRIADKQHGRAIFPPELIKVAKDHPLPSFPQRKLDRPPLRYPYQELLAIARRLDGLEAERGWTSPGDWAGRLERMLRFRALRPDGTLGDVNADDIFIDNMTHIPGMVGAGKSTVATLIAADFYLSSRGHVVLIAPDVPDVMRQVNFLNTVLSGKGEKPAAVPLVGFSERDTHLRKLFNNERFDVFDADPMLRYLDTTCLVINWLSGVDDTRRARTLTPGRSEPCEKLLDAEEYRRRYSELPEDEDKEIRIKRYQCPLFSICPMHAVYHDLFQAPIWVTTAGALAQGHVPVNVDPRGVTWWTLIYEHADLVIFDEIDASQSWFDGLFAPELPLDDSNTGGLLQSALKKLGDYPSGSWRRSSDADRWRQSFDQTIPLTRNMLGMVEGDESLRRWLTRLPYSPVRVIEDLAQRLSWRYLWYDDENEAAPQEIENLYREIHSALITVARTEPGSDLSKQSELVQELVAQISTIALQGRSQISRATRQATLQIIQSLRERITHFEPVINERLARRTYFKYLQSQGIRLKKAATNQEDMEPLSERRMVNRLEFTLVVIALDNALRGVFYGWASVEDLLGSDFFPSFIPRSMLGLVPVPPTGLWRGFRSMPARTTDRGDSLSLSTFEYAGVGRHILSRFSKLMTDLDGLPGPHVLAMSGTSYLPESSRFHFAQAPVGVLEPPADVQAAIRGSRVSFIPQADDGKLLRVSGTGDQMDANLGRLLNALSKVPNPSDSVLVTELERLKRLGEQDADRWADRARIILMVNSYDQAEKVMQSLRVTLPPPYNAGVFYLARSGDDSRTIWMQDQRILRSEVEARASEAQILVAPMGALGRGYNLVSPVTRKAAFGSIYFLIRPMTPPHDANEMVAGINSYLDGVVNNPASDTWSAATIYEQMRALRRGARREWQVLETQQYYRSMPSERKMRLGANTASMIIQACGRLVRGGVPFNAYFVDASWVQPEEDDAGEFIARPTYSLLASVVQVMNELAATPLGAPLYGAFAHALANTHNVSFHLD